MSSKKYYKSLIQIPESITIKRHNQLLIFSGPFGSTTLNLKKIDPFGLSAINIDIKSQVVQFITRMKPFFRVFNTLFKNKLQGITYGFLVYLKIVGTGYKAQLENNTIIFKLGYSHDIVYKIPPSILIFLVNPTTICLFGIDKNQITQIAVTLRNLRKPSTYKGKGIRFLNEHIVLKIGKRQ